MRERKEPKNRISPGQLGRGTNRPQPTQIPGVTGLIFTQMANIGLATIPSVTFLVIIIKVILYQDIIHLAWGTMDLCISANEILHNHDFKRLLMSPLVQPDEKHLYFNLLSFLIKGRSLENNYGSSNFALLLTFLWLFTNILYVVNSVVTSIVGADPDAMDYCSLGFESICFALKVITTADIGQDKAYVFGVEMPTKYAAWTELIVIHQMLPNVSFTANISGIMAGILYIATPLGAVVDKTISLLTRTPTKDLPHLKTKTRSSTQSVGTSSRPKTSK